MLNQLLEEISHSERSFKEKATRLKFFSEEVEASLVQLQLAREENELLQGEIKSKALVHSEANEELHSSKVHLALLTKQRNNLTLEKQRIEDQLNQLTKDMDCTRQAFVCSVTEFNGNHMDNLSKGCHGEDLQLENEMATCRDRIAVLTSELSAAEADWEEMSYLLSEHGEVKLAVENAEVALRDAIDRCNELERDLGRTQKDFNHLSSPVDVTITQLQGELDKYRQQSPEELCRALKKELEAAQQEYYQRRWRRQRSNESSSAATKPMVSSSTSLRSELCTPSRPAPQPHCSSTLDDVMADCGSVLDFSLENESLLSLSVEGFDQGESVGQAVSTSPPNVKNTKINKKVQFQYNSTSK